MACRHCVFLVLNGGNNGFRCQQALRHDPVSGNDMFSHQVRIVLAEKGVTFDICMVDVNNLPEERLELNPYNSVPNSCLILIWRSTPLASSWNISMSVSHIRR